MASENDLIRARASGVFKFLRDLAELRSKTVRDIAQYESVWWLSDLPRESGCHFIGWQPVPEVDPATPWVEVRKPRLKPVPPVPPSVQPWLLHEQLSDSNLEAPELQQIIEIPSEGDEPSQVLVLEECLEVIADWENYLERQWRPWAAQDRINQRIQLEYANLFSIYQKQKTLGENYEVVFCFGFLTWRSDSGSEVARHLITAQTSISFDDVRGIVSVGAAADGARLSLEQDMLDPGNRPDVDNMEAQLRDSEFVMWDGQTLPGFLKGWVQRLSAAGEYDDALTNQTQRNQTPFVSLAPAIVMRRRGERTIISLFKDLIDKFESGTQPSTGILRLVSVIDERLDSPSIGGEAERPAADIANGDLYLPLLSNKEQRAIVNRLDRQQGILVQGPPGTGKSHTIANLLCHLLALGKRVLVTSHTARALSVLQHKLPPEIAKLCVLLLGNDLTALQGLEDSVREITERYNNRNSEDSAARIQSLSRRLDEARQAEAGIYQRLRALREADTYKHSLQIGDYSGTTQTIASRLHEREPQHAWVAGFIDSMGPPPLSDAEAVELFDLQEIANHEVTAKIEGDRPRASDLFTPSDFSDRVRDIKNAQNQCADAATYNDTNFSAKLQSLSAEDFTRLHPVVLRIYATVDAHKSADPWVRACLDDIVARNATVWAERLASTNRNLGRIGDHGRWASERVVTGLEGRDLSTTLADTIELLRHLQAGGRLGFGPFKHQSVKRARYIIDNVRVDGRTCKTADSLESLRLWLTVNGELDGVDRVWSQIVTRPNDTLAIKVAHYTGLRDRLKSALELSALVEIGDDIWRDSGHHDPLWTSRPDLEHLAGSMRYCHLERELKEAYKPLQIAADRLHHLNSGASVHPVAATLKTSIETLGIQSYREAYQTLEELEQLAHRVQRYRDLTERLRAAAPGLVNFIESSEGNIDLRIRLQEFSKSWHWAQADAWLRQVTDPKEKHRLESESERNKKKVQEFLTLLAAEKAWSSCLGAMTERQRRHLVGWQLEIKKLGKGTAKHAATHRHHAREELEGARGAVPAWIMPLYRVADTLKVNSDQFDVIIIDEASQSGPDAMFLLEFAKQIIIVGDDKQIKPDVFVDQQVVDVLRRRHIPDIPSSTLIGAADTSLFEIGELLYGGRVRLREHFRCMPEIIQFSNNLCYVSEPLIPLRQFGASRLKPVVTTRYIIDGFQKGPVGRIVNPPEAQAIVDFMADAIRDPKYAKKTFGIISLLGQDQAKLIEHLLLERVGPEEMQRRNLVCGDAYAFQGDERDVMLLSLVSAPTEGAHIGVLARPADERRFNVAASRAKDQMILFHTATLNDLSTKCLRHRLLEYCLNPKVDALEVAGIKLDDLRQLASSPARDHRNPPEPFDSWFEVDVCIKIMERGYRVVPQYQVAGYFVDLMVEGINGRIAVECDGDEWHGPEQYDSDMSRERELVRAGLHFFRPRGSEYYRDPNGSLAGLWELLRGDEESNPQKTEKAKDLHDAPNDSTEGAPEQSMSPDGAELVAYAEQRNTEPDELFDVRDEFEPNGATAFDFSADGQESILREYEEWSPRAVPDPRTCSSDDVALGLVEIARAEGPIVFARAYRLYARAAGIHRVGHQLRSLFNRAAARAVRQGLIKQSDEPGNFGQAGRTAWSPSAPSVSPRQRGSRTADEIPKSEVVAVARMLLTNGNVAGSSLVQATADAFGVGRLTTSTRLLLVTVLKEAGLS